MRIDVEVYKAMIEDLYPLLSGKRVKRAANLMAAAQTPPSAWNITETVLSGRAPGDGRRVCVAPRRQKRGGPDLDPATVSDQHRADPTASRGVRNALAAQRRVGA